MKRIGNLLRRFYRDESGAEVTELAIALGLIVALCMATMVLIAPKIQIGYTETNAALQ